MPDPNEDKLDFDAMEKFKEEIGLRVVDKFAKGMKTKLMIKHKEKGGWADVSPEWLMLYLETEIAELKEALISRDSFNIQDEAVDVANLAMMIWDVVNRPAPADGKERG